MRKFVFLLMSVMLFSGCSVLWDYKPHVIGDEGEKLPNKHLFYVEDGVNVLVFYKLVDRIPSDDEIKSESKKYIKEAGEKIINKDWNVLIEKFPINKNDKKIMELKEKCADFIIDLPDSLISVKKEWVRKYKKRRFLWFYKNMYDIQYIVHYPLYKKRKELPKLLEKYKETNYVPLRTFAVYYTDLIEGKIKIEKGKEE